MAAAEKALPGLARHAAAPPRPHPGALPRAARGAPDELARLVTQEHGKTLPDAAGSLQRGIEVVEFAEGIPHLLKGEQSEDVAGGVDSHSVLQPVGVCAGITPFNFPAMVPMWMFPVAIACGNTFVLKPSEKDPSRSLLLARLFHEAGLPDGVLNVVLGDGEAVDALLVSPRRERGVVRRLDADRAARLRDGRQDRQAGAGARGGEEPRRGPAGRRAGVHRRRAHRRGLRFGRRALHGDLGRGGGGRGRRPLVERLREKAEALKVGPGTGAGVEMGPLVTAAHRDRIRGIIEKGALEGAKPVLDGRGLKVPGAENGFFLGPTLFDHVTTSMTVYREEIFGPVLVVVRVRTLDEAIAIVNQNPYGNGTAIFTNSGDAARSFEHEIQVGMVGINVPIPVPMAFYSFGGWKQSLFGDLHVHGMEGVKFYTRTKAVTTRWPEPEEKGKAGYAMPTLG